VDNISNTLSEAQIEASRREFGVTPLNEIDLKLIEEVRVSLFSSEVRPPDWRDRSEESMTAFFQKVQKQILVAAMNGTMDRIGMPAEAKMLRDVSSSKDASKRLTQISTKVTDALIGLGLLEPLLRDDKVEEIFVRDGSVAVEKGGILMHLGKMASDDYFYRIAVYVADQSGSSLRAEQPAVLTDLPDGQRFTAIVPPLSRSGTSINIRCFGRKDFSLADIESVGSFTYVPERQVDPLQMVLDVATQEAIMSLETSPARYLAWVAASLSGSALIAGDFSGGKTTLLNALSAFFPTNASVAVLETFHELQLRHPFQVRVVAPAELSKGEKGVTLSWVLNTIYTRMNPGLIALGEIVVPREAIEFLRATNFGRVAFTTIHGDSVKAALARLEGLALAAEPDLGLSAIRDLVALGVKVVILTKHVGIGRVDDDNSVSRYVSEIALVSPSGDEEKHGYSVKTIYRADNSETSLEGESLLMQSWNSIDDK